MPLDQEKAFEPPLDGGTTRVSTGLRGGRALAGERPPSRNRAAPSKRVNVRESDEIPGNEQKKVWIFRLETVITCIHVTSSVRGASSVRESAETTSDSPRRDVAGLAGRSGTTPETVGTAQ